MQTPKVVADFLPRIPPKGMGERSEANPHLNKMITADCNPIKRQTEKNFALLSEAVRSTYIIIIQ